MRNTLSIVVVLVALVVTGCQKPSPSAASASAPAAQSPDEGEKAPSAVAQTVTQVESALKRAKRPFKRAEVKVTDEQLETIVASGYEVFESTEDPKIRVFVFHYDAQELVKPAKVARWINGSGLIHNGQTSANRLNIIVAGTAEAGTLDEETNRAMNDFMDAFMMMR